MATRPDLSQIGRPDLSQIGVAQAPAAPGFLQPFAEPEIATANLPTLGAQPARSALGEIGTGLARGTVVEAPRMFGQALRYTGRPGDTLYDYGQELVQGADTRGRRPEYTMQPEQHGAITNALAAGAQALPASVAPAAALLAAPVAGTAAAGAAAIGIGAALGGLSAGQETLDRAQAAGVDEGEALEAARLNALQSGVVQGALSYVGGRVLGVAGNTLARDAAKAGTPIATQALNQMTGRVGAISATARELPRAALLGGGLGSAQLGTEAAIEQAYGISNRGVADSVIEGFGPGAAQAVLLAPFGAAGRALSNRGGQRRANELAAAETPADARTALAEQYARGIEAAGTPEALEAAANFRVNANDAIANNRAMDVNSSLFDAPLAPEAPVAPVSAEPLGLPNLAGPMIATAEGQVFPNEAAARDLGYASTAEAARVQRQTDARPVAGVMEEAAPVPVAEPTLLGLPNLQEPLYVGPGGEVVRGQQGMNDYASRFTDMGWLNQAEAERVQRQTAARPVTEVDPATAQGAVQQAMGVARLDQAALTTAWTEANTAAGLSTGAQSRVPFERRIQALGIDRMNSLPDQISALDAAVADTGNNMSQGLRDRMAALADNLRTRLPQEPEAAAPGEPLAAAVETATAQEQLGQAVADGNVTPQRATELANAPVTEVQRAVDENANMPTRITNAEQRLADEVTTTEITAAPDQTAAPETAIRAQATRQALTDITAPDGVGGPATDAYANKLLAAADNITVPGDETPLNLRRSSAPIDNNPDILVPGATSGRLGDTLTHLEQNGSQQWVKDLATRLLGSGAGEAQMRVLRTPSDDSILATYDTGTNTATFYPDGATEHAVLHEATHAATIQRLNEAAALGTPTTPEQQNLRQAYMDLEAMRESLLTDPVTPDAYGLTSAPEFIAELNSNPDFQQYLKSKRVGGETLWQRVVDSVRRMLGLEPRNGTMLDRAIGLNDSFFRRQTDYAGAHEYLRTPEGASKVVDGSMHALRRTPDDPRVRNIDPSRVSHEALRFANGITTLQYLAERATRVPDFVRTGFDRAVAAFDSAITTRRQVISNIGDEAGRYVSGVNAALRKLNDPDRARTTSRQLATIAGEASRMGFDFTKNFNDNVKAGRTLDAANRDYINDIYRQYRQLAQNQPELAKALVDGAKLSRKDLVTRVSTIASTLMDSVAARQRTLTAELNRLGPDDANRAQREDLQNRLAGLNNDYLFASKYSAGLDIMDRTLRDTPNRNTDIHYDNVASTLDNRLNAAFEAARALPDSSTLRGHMRELESMFRAQSESPYFSLGRSGDFFVNVKLKNMDAATAQRIQGALEGTNKVLGDLQGEESIFLRVDSLEQAAALRRKLVAAGGAEGKVYDAASGRLADRSMVNASGVSPAIRNLLAELDDTNALQGVPAAQAEQIRAALTRQIMSMLPETSARSAKMQRTGVPGYDADFVGNFSRRVLGSATDTANMYTNRAFQQSAQDRRYAIEQMAREGKEDSQARAQLFDDEINRRYMSATAPLDNNIVSTITALGHTWALGASPSYLLMNATQVFHRGLPVMGSQYGFAKSMGEIVRAAPVAYKLVKDMLQASYREGGVRGLLEAELNLDNTGLNAREKQFVQEMNDRGALSLGMAQQLHDQPLAGPQRFQNAVRYIGLFSQYSEFVNRLTTGLAAFRLAEARNGTAGDRSFQTHTNNAITSVDRVMDNFSPENTARLLGRNGFAGRVTPLMTQFMNYNFQTMQQIDRALYEGWRRNDPTPEGQQRALEARREMKGLMGTTFMLAGTMGLPFAGAFAGMYNILNNALSSDDEPPSDIRIDARNWLASVFGKDVGDVIAHGPLRALNLDTSRMGLQDILPGTDFLTSRQLWSDRVNDQALSLMGPAFSTGVNITNGLVKMSDGYYTQGIQSMLPSGIRPYYQAANLAISGTYTDSRGNPLPLQPEASDIAWQAVGFRSGRRADASEAMMYLSANQKQSNARKTVLMDQAYKAYTAGTAADQAAALKAIENYNQRNPYSPIRNLSSTIRQRQQSYAIGEQVGAGIGLSRGQLIRAGSLQFAAEDPTIDLPSLPGAQ